MSDWNRKRVIDWVNAHRGKPVRLRRRASGLKVEGIFPGVDEVDACSADYFEADLETGSPHLSVALTFHDDAVLVHVEGDCPGQPGLKRQDSAPHALCVSLSSSVPYGELILEVATAQAPRKAATEAEEAPAEEVASSPYELLH